MTAIVRAGPGQARPGQEAWNLELHPGLLPAGAYALGPFSAVFTGTLAGS